MTDEYRSTRLGDLLVEQGAITRQQLSHAIELQQIRRKHAIKINAPNSYKQELGELLIELGFINRSQLKSSLSWQKRLRKTTAVMVFIAPLLTAACGGGGGGSGSGTNNVQSLTQHSQTLSSDSAANKPTASSAPSLPSSSENSSSSSSSNIVPVSSSSFSSLPTHSSSSSSSSSAFVNGSVQIYWVAPTHRENGTMLDITEIGGYEIRYKHQSDKQYKHVVINDGYVDAYYFENLNGDYEFQIAAFDVQGVYSTFAQIKPQ